MVVKNNLTLVTRLGDEGFPEIYDLQLCLMAQKDTNFQWIILLRPSAHKFERDLRLNLELYPELYERTKIIRCKTDNRSKLLNSALQLVDDGYITIFDDDDLPLSSYVSVIRESIAKSKGNLIIRTQVVQIETLRVRLNEFWYQVAKGKALFLWPESYNRYNHMSRNQTPCMAVSYPVKLLKKNNLNWDERLHAVEDWDLLIRASGVIPVFSVEVPTSIYRRAQGVYRSNLVVSPVKWSESETKVRLKIEKLEFGLTGSEIMSLVGSNRSKVHKSTPVRAIIFTKLVFILKPRLIQRPRVYLLFKSLYRPIIKILRIENYV
jgi:hypothetical protein